MPARWDRARLRRAASQVLAAGLQAADPTRLVLANLSRHGKRVRAAGRLYTVEGRCVLVAAGKAEQVKVFGFDGADDVVKLIAEKKIAATGMQFPKVMAQKAAEFADQYIKGKRDFEQKIPVAVELVDRTMIDLSMENPAFRPVVERALTGDPQAILLVEFAGEDRQALLAQLEQLAELMGDLGLPGSVVKMPDEKAPRMKYFSAASFDLRLSFRKPART